MKIEDIPLERLVVPTPPMLVEAIGYPGRARYVAFYWTPYGDEVIYTDGRFSADGHWDAWLLFTRHRTIAPHLQAYNLGNSDEEATHWLLVDREACAMYVGAAREVLALLRGQHADQDQAREVHEDDISGEITFEDYRSLAESFVEVRGPKPEEIIEAMRKQDAITQELRLWLDTKPFPESS